MQEIAWHSSLLLMATTIAVFSAVLSTSGSPAEIRSTSQERLRRVLLGLALAVGLPLTYLSLTELPYHRPADWSSTATIVDAVGRQWNWTLSQNNFQVGDRVEFRVTSEDVNHGFALYDPDMRVVTQTQAMPGYVNILRHHFQRPGTYTVLCLEYCGVAHHAMAAEIQVRPR